MADFYYNISQTVVLGSYTITRLAQYVKIYGDRFMILLDPALKESNMQQKVMQPLNERNVDYFTFDRIEEGSSTSEIEQVLNLARQSYIDGIIAVGGAKVLHLGQVVASLINEKNPVFDYIDGTAITTRAIPLICVPTTVRDSFIFSPIVPIEDMRFRQLKILKIQPDVCRLVVWDPNLGKSLSDNSQHLLCIDALGLAVEAYLSQKASFFSDMFSEKACELFGQSFDEAQLGTSKEALLTQAGCMASMAAASSSVGVASLLSMTINARFGISKHRISCALLPHIIDMSKNFKADRVEKLSKLLKFATPEMEREEAISAFSQKVRDLVTSNGGTLKIEELKLSMEQLSLAAEDAGQLEIMNGLPRSMTTDDLFDILKAAY